MSAICFPIAQQKIMNICCVYAHIYKNIYIHTYRKRKNKCDKMLTTGESMRKKYSVYCTTLSTFPKYYNLVNYKVRGQISS